MPRGGGTGAAGAAASRSTRPFIAGNGDMNFRNLFQDFNASKFVVYTALLIFSILFALRLDNIIDWSWWTVFIPLWVWKGITIAGAIVGSWVWWRSPQNRLNVEEYVQYKAMLISLSMHLLLLMFELLVVDNMESRRHLWILVFVPLVFISIISVAVCIWSVRHDRSFEMELFCALNILQFIFLALKLDRLISWPWEITFVPMWIVLCVSLVGVLYTVIFAGILMRMPEMNLDHRRTSTNSALGYSFLVIPLLVFLVLLTNKLDGSIRISYFSTFAPLYLTFFTLIITSFGSRGGNQFWFGLRKPPCQFIFSVCPCLQLFGNISYSLYSNSNNAMSTSSASSAALTPSLTSTTDNSTSPSPDLTEVLHQFPMPNLNSTKKKAKQKDLVVVPAMAIEMPD